MKKVFSGIVLFILSITASHFGYSQTANASSKTKLGRLSADPYSADSTSNPYSDAGSPYSPTSIRNPYGQYGDPYSSDSATNPYATDTPKLYSSDGTYLGKVSSNRYDPESISNPYGEYGSPYSSKSVNNPYGEYGSPYSSKSANNPYATDAPIIAAPEGSKDSLNSEPTAPDVNDPQDSDPQDYM